MKLLSLPFLLLLFGFGGVGFFVGYFVNTLVINVNMIVHIFTLSCPFCFYGKHEPKHGVSCDLSCV